LKTTLPLLLASMFRMSFALFIPSLGELISEKAGVYNVALEGYMLTGAVTGFLITAISGNVWLGLLAGMLAGMILSLIHAYISVTIKANQFISGMALYLFSLGFTSFIFRMSPYRSANITGLQTLNIPILSKLPFIGVILFSRDILFYIGLALIIVFYILLYKTRFGLLIRSTGENPFAVDMAGYSVAKIRYTGVLICGLMSGLGGAYLPLVIVQNFGENLIAGRGFISLCIVILGRWNPFGVFAGALVFAFVDALQMFLQASGSSIPFPLLIMLPYVVTIIVLVGLGPLMKRAEAPRKLAIPYIKGEV
jgi:general nucleoside transport system permease protein